MSNFFTRTITAVLFVFVIVGSGMWNTWLFAGIFAIFMTVALSEYYTLVNKTGAGSHKIPGIITGLLLYIYTFIYITDITREILPDGFVAIIIIIPIIAELLSKRRSIRNLGYTYIGLVYVVMPFILMLLLTQSFAGETGALILPIYLFFFIWANDTFAYLVGINIGKHKMAEKISPKKSWEGAIGGLVFTLLLAFILSGLLRFLNIWEWLGLAAIVVITGTIGDLLESMLKRKAGIKDSGTFFPGHGGVLDRFDSFLIAAPFAFIYLKIIEYI